MEALEKKGLVKDGLCCYGQAFGVPAFLLTHIHRLMYGGFSNGKNVVQTEKDAKRLFPKALLIKCIFKSYFTEEYSPAREFKK